MARRRTWTDDDLIAAIDGADSLAEVVRRLRLSHGGAAFTTVRTRIEQLGLPDPRDPVASPASAPQVPVSRTEPDFRRWSDAELRDAVAASASLHQVFERLELSVGGSQWAVLRARIKALGCDTTHWVHSLETRRSTSFGAALNTLLEADLVEILGRCHTRAEVLRSVGLEPSTTTYRALREALSRVGMASLQPRVGGRPRRPLATILVADSDWRNTARLRERIIEEGLRDERCDACGIVSWRGRPAPLQLDHVDGDRRNNRLENLRILCANCHALTATWCARNRGRDGPP